MSPGIVWIDMQIRDERVLSWIREKTSDGPARIPHHTIAHEFHCHRLTARAIVKRLIDAGLVKANKSAMRGGYVYEVVQQ